MSEQVINIKDRIEKMRTQMTGPNEAVARDKVNLEKTANSNLHNKKSKFNENQMSSIKNIENSKVEDLPLAREKVEKIEKKRNEQEFGKKANESKNFEYSSFESKPKPAPKGPATEENPTNEQEKEDAAKAAKEAAEKAAAAKKKAEELRK